MACCLMALSYHLNLCWRLIGETLWRSVESDITSRVRAAVLYNEFEHHDDVIKWKHFPRYRPCVRGIHRSPVNSPHKGQWRGALMFSLICVWINDWVNNREAGDLKRYRANYDVTLVLYLHFNMTVWVWAGDYINCAMAASLIKLHRVESDITSRVRAAVLYNELHRVESDITSRVRAVSLRQVISCETKAKTYYHTPMQITETVYGRFHKSLVSKSTS